MQPNEAVIVRDQAIANAEYETPVNRKVILAVPPGQEGYAPDPKSMNALKLAWHIASSDLWFLNSVADGRFASGSGDVPEGIRSAADVVAWYDANRPAAEARVRAMSGEDLARTIDFFGMMQMPAAWYLGLNIRHQVHHRGQLSAYLRPMGAKVPGIYGPSGDEPIK